MADRTVTIRLVAATGQFQTQMAAAAASTKGLAGNAGAAAPAMRKMGGAASGAAGKMSLLAPTLIGAGGILAGLKGAASAAIEWESAWAGVTKTVDGTPEQMQAISDGLRDLSTRIPTSAGELAKIAESAGQLGIETDNVLGFTETIADLAETTNLGSEEGATSLARFANVTQMAQSDFDRLGSTIVDLGNNFATTESEIVDMAQRLAGAGSQVGMAESDILAVATALSSVGIEAEAGGSAVSKVMIEIADEVENGGDKLATFAEVAGMSTEQFVSAWRDDAASALGAFVTGLGDMEESGGSALGVLADLEITEVRMRDALLRASGAGDLFTEALDRSSDAWSTNLALGLEAAQRYDTTASKLEVMKNRWDEVVIAMASPDEGTGLLDVLDRAIEKADRLANIAPSSGGGERTIWDFLFGEDSNAQWDPSSGEMVPGAGPMSLGQQKRVDTTASARLSGMAAAYQEYQDALQDRSDEAATARLEGLAEAFGEAGRQADGAKWTIHDNTAAMEANAELAEQARQNQEFLASTLAAARDPVFALQNALRDVDDAQQAYNEAVEEYGKNSPEAKDASWNLAEAIAGAEQAALNGDLSFEEFDRRLQQWVDSGAVTADMADQMRGRVEDLREESENYEGTYWAYYEAMTQNARTNLLEIQSIIGDIPRSISTSVSVSYTSSGGAALQVAGRGQYLIGTSHTGGMITPSMSGWMPGLASDERLRVLQTGETVIPRGGTAPSIDNSRTDSSSRTVNIYGQAGPRERFQARQMIGAY